MEDTSQVNAEVLGMSDHQKLLKPEEVNKSIMDIAANFYITPKELLERMKPYLRQESCICVPVKFIGRRAMTWYCYHCGGIRLQMTFNL